MHNKFLIMNNLYEQKKLLRKQIRVQLKELRPDEAEVQANSVFGQIEGMDEFRRARVLLAFWSLPDEVHTHNFVARWAVEKRVLLPVMVGEGLELREYCGEAELQTSNAFGVAEPLTGGLVHPSEVDFAIVPGLAFDAAGHRLGRGKGYYDRLLPQLQGALTVGVGYSFQQLAHVPAEPHDVSVGRVVVASV